MELLKFFLYILLQDCENERVTFEAFLWVRCQPDGQAEADPRGATCNQHHLLVHDDECD